MISTMPEVKRRILLVDDEKRVLQGMWRGWCRLHKNWQVEFASSGAEALAIMKQQAFDLIIADIQMPGMDGAELLTRVSKDHPSTIRFALSGFGDQKIILKVAGAAHQFFAKPCDCETLDGVVSGVFQFEDIVVDEPMRRLVSQVKSLPVLPETHAGMSEALASRQMGLEDITAIVATDVGMAAKLLHLANWTVFSPKRSVQNIAQAVRTVELDVLRNLFFSTDVFPVFDHETMEAFDIRRLYQHSMAVSVLARNISRGLSQDEVRADNAATAALLQDVGRLVFIGGRGKEYKVAYDEYRQTGVPLQELEKKLYGVTHTDVGAALMVLWGLPEHVVEAIAIHHDTNRLRRSSEALLAVSAANGVLDSISGKREEAADTCLSGVCADPLDLTPQIPLWRTLAEGYAEALSHD